MFENFLFLISRYAFTIPHNTVAIENLRTPFTVSRDGQVYTNGVMVDNSTTLKITTGLSEHEFEVTNIRPELANIQITQIGVVRNGIWYLE